MKIYLKNQETKQFLLIDFHNLKIVTFDDRNVDVNSNYDDEVELLESSQIWMKDFEKCPKDEYIIALNKLKETVNNL